MGAGGTWDSGKCGNCGRGLHRPHSCQEMAEAEYDIRIAALLKQYGDLAAVPKWEMDSAKARLRDW